MYHWYEKDLSRDSFYFIFYYASKGTGRTYNLLSFMNREGFKESQGDSDAWPGK